MNHIMAAVACGVMIGLVLWASSQIGRYFGELAARLERPVQLFGPVAWITLAAAIMCSIALAMPVLWVCIVFWRTVSA